MIRRISLLAALLFWTVWIFAGRVAGGGEDSLRIAGKSALEDTLAVISAFEEEIAAVDTVDSEKDQGSGIIWDFWIPLATVATIGGVLLLLYTQRGN